ncbi:sensor histidine kinase [Sporosarcina sp. P21c]|uniref:sensor histidine kinase n=1 Tax=Sporosarcina TaxID=1569 RepID=UPI000A1526C4|nr:MULTISPECIES: HAMP domain-containing sensor histidine kinase [Sporosarcina]ARJ39147.1 two-component sensor histidine kinase [Sporosarcina ureae]PIC66443.1 sensor histidine kinase [Sporosarcina sp. P16a]PIC82293.1 sensor histidine kinase [Sporosarcina sp. P1]PIC88284.1 sensor histidine kinase [Sporosarcina sp. P21c]PIC92089.1 sensor histidine kinase [Sporosarcina sp. P25]
MKSLYGKFLVLTVGIMVSSAIVAFLSVNTYYHRYLKDENDAKNVKVAEEIALFIEANDSINLPAYFDMLAGAGYKLLVKSPDGDSIVYGEAFRDDNLEYGAVQKVYSGQVYHGMRDLKAETFVTGYFSNESANTVGVPFMYDGKTYALFLRPDIKMLFTEIHYLLGGMVIVMAIISILAMLVVARKLIAPIVVLTRATKKVGEEQFTSELSIDRRDEIGQLANSFQQMIDRLSENDQIRKAFVSDVSHDFQSPLLNIKGYADLLMDEELPAIERIRYAGIIQSETERLSTLTKQLLLLTSLDQLISPLQKKVFRVDQQVKETVRKAQWLLQEKEMSVMLEVDDITYEGDPAFLEKVWENLLSNALKYSPDGGTIDIRLTERNNEVYFSIEDTGIGMSTETKNRIFDRFYRADHSRTREVEGTGLGLSIVEQVVRLHDGRVEVVSELGKGTLFIVYLPKL